MDELLSLNLFALSLPLAWCSAVLFGGLILVPLYRARDRNAGPGAANCEPSH